MSPILPGPETYMESFKWRKTERLEQMWVALAVLPSVLWAATWVRQEAYLTEHNGHIPLWNIKGQPRNSVWSVGKDISKCVENDQGDEEICRETVETAEQNALRFGDESSYNLHVSLFSTVWQSMKDIFYKDFYKWIGVWLTLTLACAANFPAYSLWGLWSASNRD